MISILKHISFARDWLDKAEEKINYGSLLDGELYLSLAEAEVRKAWEGSVSQRREEKSKQKSKKRHYLFASALAIALVFLSATYLYTPSNVAETIELQLTDGFRERASQYQEENEIRLINVDFMIDNNIDRGNLN
ncbi:hypothetical protein [Natronospora cellulosivora (SeqCode)]